MFREYIFMVLCDLVPKISHFSSHRSHPGPWLDMTCVFLSVTLNGWGHVWDAEMGSGYDKNKVFVNVKFLNCGGRTRSSL